MHRCGHIGMAMLAYAPVGYLFLQERRLDLALLRLLGVLLVEPLLDNDLLMAIFLHFSVGTSHSLLYTLLVGGVIGVIGALGFVVGVYGILVHLLADVITISEIRPLLPLSRCRVSLSSFRAESEVANNGLFGLGVLALAVTLLVTATGIGIATGPLDLSPVDVATAQSQNNSTSATVIFNNQTTNGSVVTVKRVTLPASGFVALDDTGPGEEGSIEEDTIAVSDQFSAGTHRNVSIPVNQSPPGGMSNQTVLNATGTYQATLYEDTNDNSRFEYLSSARSEDDPFIVSSGESARLASDSAGVAIKGLPNGTQPAAVQFTDQRTNGSSVMVENVTLPQGGFVVVHNESYLVPGSDPLRSAVGLSAYLSAGTHQRVTVDLLNGTVSRSQRLVAVPSRDTNANQRYDYVRSDGFQDVPYRSANGSVGAVANVTVPESEQHATPSTTSGQPTRTSTSASTTTSLMTATEQTTSTPTPTTKEFDGGERSFLFSALGVLIVIITLVAIVSYFVRRYQS